MEGEALAYSVHNVDKQLTWLSPEYHKHYIYQPSRIYKLTGDAATIGEGLLDLERNTN